MQVAENASGKIDPAIAAFLKNAIGYTPGSEWSSFVQPVADILPIGAMLLFSNMGAASGAPHRHQPRPESAGGLWLSTVCWVALLGASIIERTMLHLPYFVLALVALQTWASSRRRPGSCTSHRVPVLLKLVPAIQIILSTRPCCGRALAWTVPVQPLRS